jgi:hypothetical protein
MVGQQAIFVLPMFLGTQAMLQVINAKMFMAKAFLKVQQNVFQELFHKEWSHLSNIDLQAKVARHSQLPEHLESQMSLKIMRHKMITSRIPQLLI